MRRKPDEAHVRTDRALADLERRIAAEYKKAADELIEKIDAYFERFQERDAAQKKLIGTIVNGKEYTQQDYKQWRLAQVGRLDMLKCPVQVRNYATDDEVNK